MYQYAESGSMWFTGAPGSGKSVRNLLKYLKFHGERVDVPIVAKDPSGNTALVSTKYTGHAVTPIPRRPATARSSILIVDDDFELSRRYQRALESYGYTVERAAQGEGAIRLAFEKHFDVVIGDVDPREGSTDRTLMTIHDQRREVPVVLLSNFLSFGSARAAADCGAYHYLLKPVSEDRLLEVLVDTIQGSPLRSVQRLE